MHRASIEIHLDQLSELPGILRAVPVSKKEDMRLQGRNIFQRFFQSVGKLVLAVLQTVEDRLATDGVNKHSYWNKMELADGYSGSFPSPMVPLQKVSGAVSTVLLDLLILRLLLALGLHAYARRCS